MRRPGTGTPPFFIEGPIARKTTRFVGLAPLMMKPPMPIRSPPWAKTRPEILRSWTLTGVEVGVAVAVGVTVAVGEGVPVGLAVALAVAVGEGVPVGLAV